MFRERNLDIIFLSETIFNSSLDSEDDSKKEGVFVYHKDNIPLVKKDDLCTLNNCLFTEIRSKKFFLTCIYNYLIKLSTNLGTFAQNSILLWITETMNFLFAQLLLEILLLFIAQNDAIKILPI